MNSGRDCSPALRQEESSEESAFRHPDAVAHLRSLTGDKAAVHPPMFRGRRGGFTQYRLEDGEVRRRNGATARRSCRNHRPHCVGFRCPASPIADSGVSGRPHRARRRPPPTSATCQRKGRHRVRAPALVPEPWGPASARPGFPVRGPDRCRAFLPGRGCQGTRSRPGGPSDVARR